MRAKERAYGKGPKGDWMISWPKKKIANQRLEIYTVCPCGSQRTIVVAEHAWNRYIRGQLAQIAFPDLSDSDREHIISGTCARCWNEMFPPEEAEA